MNSYNVVARVHSVPSYALVGGTNRQLLKFTVQFARRVKADSTRIIELGVIIWGNKAEAAASVVKQGCEVAISGELDFDNFSPGKEQESRQRTIVIVNTIHVLKNADPLAYPN